MGLVRAEDSYQALLTAIANDIRQQHRHRQARRKELGKLKNTRAALEQKHAFLRDRMRDYQEYLRKVQESTSAGGSSKVRCRGVVVHVLFPHFSGNAAISQKGALK